MPASFLARLSEAVHDGTFVKATFGASRANDKTLQKILVRLVDIRGKPMLSFVLRHTDRDITRNHSVAEGLRLAADVLQHDFQAAHLFTTAGDLQWHRNRDGQGHLKELPPAKNGVPSRKHDRVKKTDIHTGLPWLHALGITTREGGVKTGMADKMKQIARFTEILSHTVRIDSDAKGIPSIFRAVDMGCGKGLLTFAIFEFLKTQTTRPLDVTGIELRPHLVDFSNAAAAQCGLQGLQFVPGEILTAPQMPVDLLVALHACDTATDDAICHGIRNGARWILLAPCCHKELRPSMRAPEILRDVLLHGIFLERSAEMLTDSLRALVLEACGYRVKVFEFVSPEHTGRNILIAAERAQPAVSFPNARERITTLKKAFGIESTHLETRLADILDPV